MSEQKRYYWIKLKTDFFNQETVDLLLSQPNGCQYVVLYQMLCLSTANNGGEMATRVGEMIVPYNVDKIVRDTKYFDHDTVTVALGLFKQLGLIYAEEDGVLRITDFVQMVGHESANREAIKKREYRLRKKLMDINGDKMGTKCPTEIEIRDKSIEYRDIYIDKKKKNKKKKEETRHQYGEYKNVLLSDQELDKLKAEFPYDWEKRIENVSAYCASKGKAYKNYLATIRNWAKKDAESSKPKLSPQEAEYIRLSTEDDLPF